MPFRRSAASCELHHRHLLRFVLERSTPDINSPMASPMTSCATSEPSERSTTAAAGPRILPWSCTTKSRYRAGSSSRRKIGYRVGAIPGRSRALCAFRQPPPGRGREPSRSADSAALSSVRVMGPCIAMGAAAAHALDLAGSGSVAQIDVAALRQRVRDNLERTD